MSLSQSWKTAFNKFSTVIILRLLLRPVNKIILNPNLIIHNISTKLQNWPYCWCHSLLYPFIKFHTIKNLQPTYNPHVNHINKNDQQHKSTHRTMLKNLSIINKIPFLIVQKKVFDETSQPYLTSPLCPNNSMSFKRRINKNPILKALMRLIPITMLGIIRRKIGKQSFIIIKNPYIFSISPKLNALCKG